MENLNTNIKKINTAGKVGYVISILLIVCLIVAMVAVGLCTIGALAISDNEINIKVSTDINVDSKGDFIDKINSFVFINGVDDLNTLAEKGEEGIKLEDDDLSEISVVRKDEGLVVNAKTNEVTIGMKRIIMALGAAFIYLAAVTVSLYKIKALMKSLKTCETPFSEDVIKNMSKLATALICVAILKMVLGGFWTLLRTGSKFNLSIDLGNILLIAVIYVLITVFKYGAGLQHESDETL